MLWGLRVPIRNVQILVLLILVCFACNWQAERMRYAGQIGSAIQMIEQNYVEAKDADDLYFAAMNGLMSNLDQYSEFIPPIQLEQFQSVIQQKFGGLGILIEGPPVAEQLTVVAPIPNTPAFEAGLQPGDVITKIGGQSTENLSATDATKLMRGPVGEPIELEIRRMTSSELLTVNILRADINVDSVYGDHILSDSSWDYFLEEDSRIAYIRITIFGDRTTKEFAHALKAIKDKAKAVVIDLRFNPGGLLPAAVNLCDMLVDSGTIVTVKGRNTGVEMSYASPAVQLDKSIPIVVLINGQSASASEIMAGCLVDLDRAEVAGSRSFGKGTVQQVFPLDGNRSALKFTTANYFRPSGANVNKTKDMQADDVWGVKPDPELQLKTTELQDIYLNRRWQRRGDPRLTTATERAPEPELAGDPQLRLTVKHLRKLLDGRK